MRTMGLVLLLGWCLIGATLCAADDKEIDKLIEQLGDEQLTLRKAACKRLEAIGDPALPQLRKAEHDHSDPDVRLRAGVLVRAIENKGWSEDRVIVGPTRGYWINRVAFTPDGKYAVAAGGAVILYDLTSGEEVRRVLEVRGARLGLALSADGKYCLTGHTNDATVHLLELPSLRVAKTFAGHTSGVQEVALSTDGSRVATCGNRNLHVWDTKSGKEVFHRGFPGESAFSAAFSPDGKHLVSGHQAQRNEALVRLWNADTGKELRTYRAHKGTVTGVAFAPEGRRFITAGHDGSIREWSLDDDKPLNEATHEGGVYDLAISADGKRFVTAGFADKNVRVWNPKTFKELHCFRGHQTRVLGVAFSRDGRKAISCDADCNIRLWNLPP